MRSKIIAVLVVAVAILGIVPAFAAEPVTVSPALPQPAPNQPTYAEAAKEQPMYGETQSTYGETAQEQPMYAQPADAVRFYTQWELHQASVYRSEPSQYRESPGGDAGASGGDSSGN